MQLLALAFIVVSTCLGVDAGRVITYPSHIRTKRDAYIVEFESHIPSTHVSRFHAMPDIIVKRHYTNAFNGISVATTKGLDPVHLANTEGVLRVWPVRYHYAFSPSRGSAQLNSTESYLHRMTGVQKTFEDLGLNGKGVKIGIVDSGVDYNHPDLGGCWKTKGCPWQYGEDFIGDKFSMSDADPIIEPNPTPMDCNGHGTHVSGIIAARGSQVHGVAPGATLGMYRVFSCTKDDVLSTADDIILQGIEAAYADGHDIISLSLGGGAWPEEPLSVACSKIVEQGVVVVAALGNDGIGGLHTAAAPAVGHGVISVGSVDNWNITGNPGYITTAQNTKTIILSTPGSALNPFVFLSDVPVVAPVDKEGSILGCSNYTEDLSGKIALIARGTCTFNDKARNALQAGAIGVLCYDNAPGVTSPAIDKSINIPFVIITEKDGKSVADDIAKGPVTIKAPKGEYKVFPSTTGGQISPFSSYGPSPELELVPLISAPGGNIWSTYPLKLGKYTSLSGTSMATPYISGAIALLKQARPKLTVDEIRTLLVASAKPITDATTGLSSSPYQSGPGLVDIYESIKSRAKIDPVALSINNTKMRPIQGYSELADLGTVRWTVRTITIKNTDSKKSVRVHHRDTVANSLSKYFGNGTYAYTPRTWPADTKSVSKSTLPQVYVQSADKTISAGKTGEFTVFIVAPKGLKDSENWYYGGFINFDLQWDGEETHSSYVVPYAGYNGDYTAQNVLSPSSEGLPALVDMNLTAIEDPSKLVIGGNTAALVVFGIAIPSRQITLTLVNSGTGKSLGYLLDGYYEYSGFTCPNCTATAGAALLNGTVFTDEKLVETINAPAGLYHVHLKALRPFGEIGNDDDYQIWDSGDFCIL
ncbi:hypothetical protein H4S08_000522 [Coemansia sp. RSA 1365]|nr:hypothetical protein H4S08_000522 [Coemansia sp. RSA 1365]